MRFRRWGPWWLLWIQAGCRLLSTRWELFSDLGASVHRSSADHQGSHVEMMHSKHIKIALLSKYLKMGGNHSNHFQSHGEWLLSCSWLNFPLFPPWQFHCVWRLTEGHRRLWKTSVAFQKHWCTATLLKACMCKSSHFCIWQSGIITCLLLRCLSQIGSDNCCLALCGNKTHNEY